MKTVVETYIIEETQELIYDNEKLAQWNKHVESLGLTGQTKIQAKDKSPVPFLHMKTSLINVFTTLCPRKVDITAYDKTPIPVEILEMAALSVREGYFDKIEIWYDDKTPDPACIGLRRNSSYDAKYPTWSSGLDKYLIGRWADVKMSFEQLIEKAKTLFVASKKDSYNKTIKEYQRKLEDLDREARETFGYDTDTKNSEIDGLPF